MTAPAPSGEQFEIVHGEQRATIVEVGGGVREYVVGERPVLDPYPREAICDGGHGAPLIPWPNRMRDGRYSFDGSDYQLELSEPAKHNAIHGLLRWRSWRASEHEPGRVVMSNYLHPSPGYPFALEVQIAYSLSDAGLSVRSAARNVGERACPYGAGQHPYLSPGMASIDDCTLQIPAETRILVDPQRSLPCGREPVGASAYDLRQPRLVGDQQIDAPFTDLIREPDGRATSRLSAPDGTSVELWVDERYAFLEVYTGDGLHGSRRRGALAVEPMTCAPNAFQSGEGLTRLEPGEQIEATWGVRLV
ncbi:MAG TPA: aldose 1-epimerase family protein [Solirubrobacteraceae bacterium]